VRVFLRERTRFFWGALLVYVGGQLLFNWLEFGLVFFILALIVGIFLNLEYASTRKKGELSAYSVFNPRGQRLAGTYGKLLVGFKCSVLLLLVLVFRCRRIRTNVAKWRSGELRT
jgi:hypothetical protein